MTERKASTETRQLADRLFDADLIVMQCEDELFELLDKIGMGESWADWGRDHYDCSLELYGVPPDVHLSDEGKQAFKDAGFLIVWLNHTDNGETTYSLHHEISESHRQTDGYRTRPQEPTEMKRLRRQLAEMQPGRKSRG